MMWRIPYSITEYSFILVVVYDFDGLLSSSSCCNSSILFVISENLNRMYFVAGKVAYVVLRTMKGRNSRKTFLFPLLNFGGRNKP